jgi:hypothetical protein
MTTNVVNQIAYLRTSREFPEEIRQLALEANKSYIDTANAVNSRTIGIFPTNRPAIGGESWFLSGNRRQQNLRQVYQFTAAGNIAHGITISSISQFTKPFGSFTDGTNFYGAIYASNVAIAGQVSFYITSTNIVVLSGVGTPTISSGIIVLEWLSDV